MIFSLQKPCYLENYVVRERCKWRSACILNFLSCEQNKEYNVKTVIYKSLFVIPTNECILNSLFCDKNVSPFEPHILIVLKYLKRIELNHAHSRIHTSHTTLLSFHRKQMTKSEYKMKAEIIDYHYHSL